MAMAVNSNGNRDDELELIRQLLIATASRTEATDARLDRLVESQERTQRQLDQLSGDVDQLREDVDIAFQTITALSENTDRAVASINAAIQRQDRILDYLMRHDGNGNEPQS